MARKTAKSRTAKRKETKAALADRVMRAGALQAKVIDPATVVTAPWVRWKCQFGCGGWGSSLLCPPHTPTPTATREMLDCYGRAILFEAEGKDVERIAAAVEVELFFDGYFKAFGMGAGPCFLCKSCAFDEGCRHPKKARPSLEACGIDVFTTVRGHGFPIETVRDEGDSPNFYGLILVA